METEVEMGKGKWRVLVSAMLLVAMLLAACSSGSGDTTTAGSSNGGGVSSGDIDPDQVWELTFNDQMPETEVLPTAELEAIANIEERTNGQVKITAYFSSTLLEAANQYSGIAQDMADISFYQIDANTGAQVLNPVFSLPVVGTRPPAEVMQKIYQEFFDAHPEFQEENNSKNVHMMAVGSNDCSILFGVSKAYEKPEDLNGQKIISTARYAPMVNAFGSSLQMPVSEYYNSLEKKLAQGQITHYAAANAFGTLELLTTHTFAGETEESGFGNQAYGYLINLDVWKSIPEKYQKIMAEEFSNASLNSILRDKERLADIKQKCKDRGDTFVFLDTAEKIAPWQEAVQLSVDAWLDTCEAAGYDRAECQKLYDDLMEFVGNYK
jgi:TRAP-type C4-dicarboxylate transport system substrate-binding protein